MNLLNKLFFLLLVVSFPLGEIARITINEVAVTAVDFAVALIVVVWLVLKRRFTSAKLFKPIAIFILALVISLVVNFNRLILTEFSISFLYLIRWVLYASLYFVVLDIPSKKSLTSWMTVGGAIVVLGGFVQYFLYPDLRNLFYLGWDEHLYRMFSSFLDPNFAGAFFVLYSLFLLNEAFFTKNGNKTILKVFSIITFIAIILTFSRSAYIMLVVGIVTFLILKGRSTFGFLIILTFIASIALISTLVLRSEGTNLLRTASGEARIHSINNALAIIKDNPIFGVGFNAYRYAQIDYGFVNEEERLIHSASGTDNSFLFVFATSGLVGLLAYLFLWLKIFLIRNSLIIASSIALIVNSFFVNSLFFPLIMLWMWILIAKESR